jgi:tetratricopeptide (TPR) repeat protein
MEDWDGAYDIFEAEVKKDEEKFYAYVNMGFIYHAKGMYEEARKLLYRYTERHGPNPIIYMTLGLGYAAQSKYDSALILLHEGKAVLDLPVLSYVEIVVHHLKGDFNTVKKIINRFMNSDDEMWHGMAMHYQITLHLSRGQYSASIDLFEEGMELSHRIGQSEHTTSFKARLVDVYISQGRYDQAIKTCDEVIDWAIKEGMLSYQAQVLTMKSVAFLQAGMLDSAAALTLRIKTLCDASLIRNIGRYFNLHKGYVKLFQNQHADAINEFKNAIALLPHESMENDVHVLFMDPLALAYYKSGDLENAVKTYTDITQLTSGRYHFGDRYAKAFYMLGRINEEQGLLGRAKTHYNTFLDLWQEADEDIPELIDARARMAALEP